MIRVLCSACMLLVAVSYFASHAMAVPIVYRGMLENGVPATDSLEPGDHWASEVEAHYWSFLGTVGDDVTVTGTRLIDELDPLFSLWTGVFSDSSELIIDTGMPAGRHLGNFDDEIGHVGPFGDPQAVLTLPETGSYTVIIGYAALHGSSPLLDYQLLVTGNIVPEPSTFTLAALGLLSLGMRRRRWW